MESPPNAWELRIDAARRGDRDAIDELFHSLRAYLHRRAEQQLDAGLSVKVSPSDIVQETFLRAFEAIGGFKGTTRGELIAWVQSILRHRLQTANRRFRGTDKRNLAREQRQPNLSGWNIALVSAHQETPSRVLMAHEEQQRLEAALRSLRPRQELAIRLRNELHLSFDEVGKALDCSEEAAQKLWARAVKRLASQLSALGGGT
ncbi:sigma-70 family RNA polymerase sigma factor [Lacipirellula limnantheis]|uniref:RNA polymerase sigma factor n=1 Tax=Lacipirellula limnantheis TaxID=2528024 RepID=A0A517TXQ7_9BACT|nr:sigma-70 family RNA polymerase sigma factor [Lacipirellula limnantheis]QDT73143.1 RNA polymerase sigma factor [Lacipirellula limnantheis]